MGLSEENELGKLLSQLSSPPYWLPKDLLTYYMASFLTYWEARVLLSDHEQPRSQETLKRLIDSSGKGFSIDVPKRVTLNEEQLSYLDALAARVAREIKNGLYQGSLKVQRAEGVLRRVEREAIRTDLEAWWNECGLIAQSRVDQSTRTLDVMSRHVLELWGPALRDGVMDADFLLVTFPEKVGSEGRLGTLAKELVQSLEVIGSIAREPRPSSARPDDGSGSDTGQGPEAGRGQTPWPSEGSTEADGASLDEATVDGLIRLLQEVRGDLVGGSRSLTFEGLVERMREALRALAEARG